MGNYIMRSACECHNCHKAVGYDNEIPGPIKPGTYSILKFSCPNCHFSEKYGYTFDEEDEFRYLMQLKKENNNEPF